jgi:hypothetical protein
LDSDRPFRRFFDQETTEIPPFIVQRVRHDLGRFWDWLPDGALRHDPNAYLKSDVRSCSSCVIPAAG